MIKYDPIKTDDHTLIDLSAIFGKTAIETTKLHPIAKLSINFSIDMLVDYLKRESLPDTEKIRRAAVRYNIAKVIAIPMRYYDSELIVFRAYGNKSRQFFDDLGLRIITEDEKIIFGDKLLEQEKKFGVEIYERKY